MTTPSVSIMPARYPGIAVDGTRIKRGAPIAWCRTTRRVLTADPKRFAALESAAAAVDRGPDRFDMLYEDSCAARCGF
jgi:hypothetical protein